MFTTSLHRLDTVIGVGIFSAFVAYDTHCAVVSYEGGNADHIGTALDFAIDFWGILTRVT